MVTVILRSFALLLLVTAVASGGGQRPRKGAYEQPLREETVKSTRSFPVLPELDWSAMRPTVGTYTTLTGFYDYQSNGGSPQYIRVQPGTGDTIFVILMIAEDSLDINGSRRTAYAMSTNRGQTWRNFNNVRIPTARRSGFPSLDIGQGVAAGVPMVANHNDPGGGAGNVSLVYVEVAPGTGEFSPLATVGGFSSDAPIWPYVAGTANGGAVMASSRNTAGTDHYTTSADLISWTPWVQFPGFNQSGGKNPVIANGNGRVGIQLNTSNGTANTGVYWLESTNNGLTWPAQPDTIYRLWRVALPESLKAYVSSDAVYNGNEPLMAITEFNGQADYPSWPRIVFWSRPTGFRMAVPFDSTKFIADPVIDQRFHSYSLGWPAIGMSGSRIVMAFQAFQRETSTRGYNFSDIWFTQSTNNGITWSPAVNLTNTPNMDERYPSMSKWNPAGEANMVWQEDPSPGGASFPGEGDTARTHLVFYKRLLTTGVDEADGLPERAALGQNYPNPFNPATAIPFTLSQRTHVTLTVHNVLGQKLATLVDEPRDAGPHTATFRGDNLPSGIYFYTLRAGSFGETHKMVLMK